MAGRGGGDDSDESSPLLFPPWLSRRCGRIRCSRGGIRSDTIGSHSHILPHLPLPTPILVLLPERVLEKLQPTPQRRKQATMIGRGRGDIILSSSFECHRRLPPPLPKPPQRPLLSSPPSPMKRGIHGSKAYVGMGGKGTVTPLLKDKVRIPPPAGHFIDPPPLVSRINLTPPLSHEKFPILQVEIITKCASKCIFRALFAILQYLSPPGANSASPPPAGKIRILPPASPLFTPLLTSTTVPKYENKGTFP